jgi:hypothetical protein
MVRSMVISGGSDKRVIDRFGSQRNEHVTRRSPLSVSRQRRGYGVMLIRFVPRGRRQRLGDLSANRSRAPSSNSAWRSCPSAILSIICLFSGSFISAACARASSARSRQYWGSISGLDSDRSVAFV